VIQGELHVGASQELTEPCDLSFGAADDVEANDDVLMRTRRLSRAVTEIYDAKLRPFGIGAVQFSLLEIIGRMQPTTRAAIARKEELDKSTLTRDLKSIFSEGWVEEVRDQANGRSRPIALTKAGRQLLRDAEQARRAAQNEVKLFLRKQGFIG
jgi:DNA-binding MarR family transcriptional regulator